ncbi:MAG: T9SS type A sorting domain-containing protein [Bacteroidales bacterium]|nr:T9SS type A sorting domain-containing protein [Bacteroidales bacterium]
MDLYVMGIDQYFDNDMVLGFMEEYNTHYPNASGLQGGGEQIFIDYQIPYTPSLILIAPDHTIVEQAVPFPSNAQVLIDFLETYNLSVSGVEDDLDNKYADFNIFPNPVENRISIQLTESRRIEQIKIYQITGQEVFSIEKHGISVISNIDISFLDQGIYLVSLEFENGGRVSKTFIKR